MAGATATGLVAFDISFRLQFDSVCVSEPAVNLLDTKSTPGPKLINGWASTLRNHARRLVSSSSVLTDAERSSLGAKLDKLPSIGASETPLSLASLSSDGTKLRLHRGVLVAELIADFTPTSACPDLVFVLHLGNLCPSRLSSCLGGPPSIAPSTPSPIPSLPTISAQTAPGAAKTTSNATFGTTTRSLPARNDSSAPPNVFFPSEVRSTGTGEGNSAEQGSVAQSVQSTRATSNRSDHAIPPSVMASSHQYHDPSQWSTTRAAYQQSQQDARADTTQGSGPNYPPQQYANNNHRQDPRETPGYRPHQNHGYYGNHPGQGSGFHFTNESHHQGPPSFPNQDFHHNDRQGSYDSSSYDQRGFGQTNGNVDWNPNKYPWNSTEHMANMSSDNVTPWVTIDPNSDAMIICHPVASSFGQGTFKSYWAGFSLD
jgi:hypothetical protein